MGHSKVNIWNFKVFTTLYYGKTGQQAIRSESGIADSRSAHMEFSLYLENDTTQSHSYNRTLIGNHTWYIEWCCFRWSWVNNGSSFKVTFLTSNISKIVQDRDTYNGTLIELTHREAHYVTDHFMTSLVGCYWSCSWTVAKWHVTGLLLLLNTDSDINKKFNGLISNT